jgi:OmcA/MtrC family decaheme c-type cytochrome
MMKINRRVNVSPQKWKTLLSLIVVGVLLVGCPIIITPNPDPDPDPTPDPVVVEPISTSPGINVEITGVEIPADLRPVVRFTVTDDIGEVVPLREMGDVRFLLAYLDPDPAEGSTARYISYNTRTEDAAAGGEVLQATYDSARLDGVVQEDDGTFTYTFASAIPEDYPAEATHQVGGQLERLFPIDGLEYPANPVFGFRPDGGEDLGSREIVNTESCNVCHTRLAIHGGARREVQLCIMCHNEGSIDGNSGNTVDFAQMVHKIHRGADLPSVQDGEPYQIYGFRDSLHDYSDVHFPQPVQNCTACHTDSPMSDIYMTTPTIAGCASCHDRAWFGDPLATPAGYTNHVAGQQVDDSLCVLCHTPTAPGPAPILEAHRLATESPLAPGLALTINEVITASTDTGAAVTINFTAEDGAGAPFNDLGELNILAATLAYPVSDYEQATRESISADNATDNGDGTFNYTFTEELPADSTDTIAVAMEGRLRFDNNGETVTQGTSSNGRMIFTVDGSDPIERRQIVDDAKCNACHNEVRLHGSLRVGVDSCVMCHNPNATDINRRPDDQGNPETVNFKDMIHKIHRGAALEMPFTIFGFGASEHDFSEIHFPGDLRNCEMCHVDGSYEIPLSMDNLSTVVTDGTDVISEKLPERASCTSCHDGLLAEVHAVVNTDLAAGVESCAVCHDSDADFAIIDVHNMGP